MLRRRKHIEDVATIDRVRCALYRRFYKQNRDKRELIDEYGRTTVAYWHAARRYIEQKTNPRKKSEPSTPDNPPWFI